MDKGASISTKINVSFGTGPLFSIAFIWVYLYLFIYNLYQISGIDNKDEDFINCSCKDKDKHFYRGLFGVFTTVWIIIVLVWKAGIGYVDYKKLWIWDEIRLDMLLIRVIMEVIDTIASAAAIPLAFIEFFSNYALMCFAGDRYCGANTPDSQLENDRDVILIVFFICMLAIKIYEKMVKTPQKAKDRLESHKDKVKNCVEAAKEYFKCSK